MQSNACQLNSCILLAEDSNKPTPAIYQTIEDSLHAPITYKCFSFFYQVSLENSLIRH